MSSGSENWRAQINRPNTSNKLINRSTELEGWERNRRGLGLVAVADAVDDHALEHAPRVLLVPLVSVLGFTLHVHNKLVK